VSPILALRPQSGCQFTMRSRGHRYASFDGDGSLYLRSHTY